MLNPVLRRLTVLPSLLILLPSAALLAADSATEVKKHGLVELIMAGGWIELSAGWPTDQASISSSRCTIVSTVTAAPRTTSPTVSRTARVTEGGCWIMEHLLLSGSLRGCGDTRVAA